MPHLIVDALSELAFRRYQAESGPVALVNAARRVLCYYPTAAIVALWREDVQTVCDALVDEDALRVERVRKALVTMTDDELMAALSTDPRRSAPPSDLTRIYLD